VFIGWTTDNGGSFLDASNVNTTFYMPDNTVTITAHFASPDTRLIDVEHYVTVSNGYGSGYYKEGATVTISADPRHGVDSWRGVDPSVGMPYFTHWTVVSGDVILENFTSATTSFTMPNTDVIIVANYNGYYSLVVINGSGSGLYREGDKATITALPRPGQGFQGWRSDYPGLAIANANAQTTTVTMPADNVVVTAVVTGSGVSELLNTDDHFMYIRGDGNNYFTPEGLMTRAEAAQLLYNLLRVKDVELTAERFDDVRPGIWYETAVNTLVSLGFIKGMPNGNFAPDVHMTRAEFATIAAQFAADLPDDGSDPVYGDVPRSFWAYKYIDKAFHYGWTRGSSDGLFHPDRYMTRVEVTVMVNKMLDRAADKSYVDNHPNLTHFLDVSEKYWAFYDIMEGSNTHDYIRYHGDEVWTD
jgi:uncharacterized repeat protein (TIGR02543 family)